MLGRRAAFFWDLGDFSRDRVGSQVARDTRDNVTRASNDDQDKTTMTETTEMTTRLRLRLEGKWD